MKDIYVKRYIWAEHDWVLYAKMHGPDAMPVLIREKVKEEPKSVGKMKQERFDELKKFA